MILPLLQLMFILFFDNIANVHFVLTIYMMMLHKCNEDHFIRNFPKDSEGV
jgi:hypothetical protein